MGAFIIVDNNDAVEIYDHEVVMGRVGDLICAALFAVEQIEQMKVRFSDEDGLIQQSIDNIICAVEVVVRPYQVLSSSQSGPKVTHQGAIGLSPHWRKEPKDGNL